MKANFHKFVTKLVVGTLCAAVLQAQEDKPATAKLTARANLVVVNISVINTAGAAVHGLSKGDFTVIEDGKPQTVRSFEEHRAPSSPPAAEAPLKLPPGTYTNYTVVPTGGALDVLLVDRLNTTIDAQADLQRQLDEYLAKSPASHRVAIFGLNSRLTMLQGFTGNPAVLREALKRNGPQSSVALENPSNNLPGRHISDMKQSPESPDGQYAGTSMDAGDDALRTFESRVALFETQARIRITLAAFNSLAQYLAGFPGKKNVAWFTGSFPTYFSPNPNLVNSFASSADDGELLHDTLNTLAKAQVAIYPVDARGLMTVPQYDVSVRGNTDPQQFNQQLAAFNGKTADEHTTMEQTARETGGQAFFNTNGLKEALGKIVASGDDYYTLTYTPTDPPKRDVYHGIEIKLAGTAAQGKPRLAYRRGYFGSDSANRSGFQTTEGGIGKLSAGTLALMSHGAPDATAIIVKASVRPASPSSSPADDDPASSTHVAQGVSGPWRRYVVDVAVPPSQVLAPIQDGSAPADVELVLLCFDGDGNIASSASGAVRLHVPRENIAKFQQEGLRMRQVISVPDKGRYYLRIGIHGLLSNGLGTVELPIASVRQLAPAS